MAIPRFETSTSLLIMEKSFDVQTNKLSEDTKILLWDYLKKDKEEIFEKTVSSILINVHMLKNMIIIVMKDAIYGYQINESYKEYLFDKSKNITCSEICEFPETSDNYGILVANNKGKFDKVTIDLYNLVDGTQIIQKQYTVENPPTENVDLIFFSHDKKRVFLFQENKKLMSVYVWQRYGNLPYVGTVSLSTGSFDRLKFQPIHKIYQLFTNVFLIYFKDDSFRLIDCDVIKKHFWSQNFLFFDFVETSWNQLTGRDTQSFPLVFSEFKMSSLAKPVNFNVVRL